MAPTRAWRTAERSDNDGLTNLQERAAGTRANLADTDGDGMPDGWEVNNTLNPLVNDAALNPDSDGLTNLQNTSTTHNPPRADTDSDGMPDGWEVTNSLNPITNDAALDPDSDSLTNLQEYPAQHQPPRRRHRPATACPTAGSD